MKQTKSSRLFMAGFGVAALAVVAWEAMPKATPAPTASEDGVAGAAASFLSLLEGDALDRATYDLGDEERFNWAFTPVSRNGLPLKDMTLEQRTAAHAMLQATLSSQGYHKANAIIELERILGVIEGRPERRDPEDYYVVIFGTPTAGGPWAWRFEGHHLSLSFSSPSNDLTITGPAFMGSNPATVPSGPKAGWRPLGREEDLARSLVQSLTAEQLAMAMIADEAPRDIITGNDRVARLDGFEGIAASALTDAQRSVLMGVIGEYVGNMDAAAAHAWMARIQDEISPDDLYFAWAGSTEYGEGHYYRVHAASFLIEYDNTQGNANHVHSVWRDLENDFGGDALARHYETGHEHN
ncbi:MAG: DUF3500 domain-containing protein [Gemmatimonadetes bacterium]|nr:DUF3500 domain-containing protein [Gemmatimonadota bacterium]MXX73380.1 DUF3500 domain-containing protein [Gemmatimonadota bacterium]MYC93031.1 DUF3500 domain-containing protein [Gemmatimonadota bacterium]MYG36333.1 DUF3500 domain-containing protein [Gemmatimonadota bacterium]MYJ17099.1 DUF3500 domain-containing protein [Gemmatimonadota bacterium]